MKNRHATHTLILAPALSPRVLTPTHVTLSDSTPICQIVIKTPHQPLSILRELSLIIAQRPAPAVSLALHGATPLRPLATGLAATRGPCSSGSPGPWFFVGLGGGAGVGTLAVAGMNRDSPGH